MRTSAIISVLSVCVVLGAGLVGTAVEAPRSAASPGSAVLEDSRQLGVSTGAEVLDYSADKVNRVFAEMKSLGLQSVRIDLPWPMVEPKQGSFDWTKTDRVVNSARAHGLAVLGILDYTPKWAGGAGYSNLMSAPARPADFGAYARAVAAHYGDRVAGYEIWNEPNAAMFFKPPNASVYTALLKAAYPQIKAAAPEAAVVAGAVAFVANTNGTIDPVTFVQGIYDNGGRAYFDALSIHPYSYPTAFTDDGGWPQRPTQYLASIRRMMVERGDAAKKVLVTEFGAPTKQGKSEDQQQRIILDMIGAWRSLPWAGQLYLFSAIDKRTGSANAEDSFGLLRSDFGRKPAATAVAELVRSGLPAAAIESRFTAFPAQDALTPAYSLTQNCTSKEYLEGAGFHSAKGTFWSPRPVGDYLRRGLACAAGPFANGQQRAGPNGEALVFWSAATGAHAVFGGILQVYDAALGFPTSDEYASGFGRRQDFQNGYITWNILAGAKVYKR
ncbi:cellulase family glycosylhydrolase [Gordonia alkaliphila]|uniref:cellulase family glycosylhydrolase n=1 Tax=Gordonia alkaliphila TaxID=1053547 RepID=UPI001FF161BB|nr:cellulase family glycosylhydrolase [Gordonia alkaliphila]MCK0438070.1 cellulase family glycosylhydrolase [Gordonia alkaliphila]